MWICMNINNNIMGKTFYKYFCNRYTPVCLLFFSVLVSLVCYWVQENLWLSITQVIIGIVLGLQSTLESKRMHNELIDLTKRVDETGVRVIESPEYLFLLVDSVEHILFSINKEGSVDWQRGIPKPIKLELDAIKSDIAHIKNSLNV